MDELLTVPRRVSQGRTKSLPSTQNSGIRTAAARREGEREHVCGRESGSEWECSINKISLWYYCGIINVCIIVHCGITYVSYGIITVDLGMIIVYYGIVIVHHGILIEYYGVFWYIMVLFRILWYHYSTLWSYYRILSCLYITLWFLSSKNMVF